MSKSYITVDYRGTWNNYEAEVIGEFDDWSEAADYLVSKGFKPDYIVMSLDLFIDPHSERTHWAKIYDRDIYVPPEFEELEEP